MIEFEAVEKYFGDRHILKSITGSVSKGQVVVVCGPSGSGKSTLIRTVNRLESIDGGHLRVDGRDIHTVRNINELRSGIGFVFQSFGLFPHMSALDNVMIGLRRVRKLGPAEARQIAMERLAGLGLADKADSMPAQLSGGQQQRVAIARAVSMRPAVMLFDEPTSALDPELVSEVLAAIEQLADEGMTIICVTHEMGFARRVADRIWYLEAGRLLHNLDTEDFFKLRQAMRLEAASS
ncbi:amino acid ABC transporter ATP-binding protein [Pelagibacterium sediminicola]|uniref:amino acid ABC transporter ATP-binding protein n=1 Tax=Pelagibacterium sediminicola TaxID=2248761 RepID=UPI000E3244A9|nr:amino acid ABC transporter ATP-binding protein [Pelagibacterium sediminicola]